MNFSEFCDLARDQTGVNSTDYPNTRILTYTNLVKDDLWSYLITSVKENFNWEIWTTDSISNQTEYTLPEAATDSEGALKVNSISINYDGETYNDGTLKYKKAKRVFFENLPYEWSYYVNNQPKSNPLFVIADKSIFIAPSAKDGETGENRIQVKGIKNIVNYTVNTTEEGFGLPSYLLGTLLQGVLPFIHKREKNANYANNEQAIYEKMRQDAAQNFSNRYEGTYKASYPIDPIGDSNDEIYFLSNN